MRSLRSCGVAALCVMAAGRAWAQAPAPAPAREVVPPSSLTLEQALQYASEHYPSLKAAAEQVTAADANLSVAKAAYLPRLDSLWQVNRATANNVFGQVFPQSTIPAMSGPVLSEGSSATVWGDAVGALLSWDAIDFGLRSASVQGAEASLTRARASEAMTRLEVEANVGLAFLDVIAADRARVAAQADFDRRDVLGRAIQSLVDNQLRPGADASRADAERAAAQIRLIQARETVSVAQASFARLLGVAVGTVAVDAGRLLNGMPAASAADGGAAGTVHPLVQVRQASVDFARAQRAVLAHTNLPRVVLQSSVFARGSGADPAGGLDGGVGGLGFDRTNWGAAVQIQFPNVFDLSPLRARKAAAAASERGETALQEEAVLTVTTQQHVAATRVETARAVAANTPLQLAAAQQTETQARARYQAGLSGLVELADAQNLLAQAEAQDQLARVDVWRALLAQAVAHGDLGPFLTIVRLAAGVP